MADDLTKLSTAIIALNNVIRSMGPGMAVVSITIDDGCDGHLFDSHMRAAMPYVVPDLTGNRQRKIAGVQIEVKQRN